MWGVANKINELALVEGNLPSSLVRVLRCCAPGSVCVERLHPANLRDSFMQNCFCNEIHIMIFFFFYSILMCGAPQVDFAKEGVIISYLGNLIILYKSRTIRILDLIYQMKKKDNLASKAVVVYV